MQKNIKMSLYNTKHCYIKISDEHTPECIEIFIQIRMIEPIHIVEGITTGDIKSDYVFIFPKMHIPPTNLTQNRNISPVERYKFAQLRLMQNFRTLMYSPGAN